MYKEMVWMDAKRMRAQGMSYVEIGERLGIDRRTAKKLCLSEDPPRPKRREGIQGGRLPGGDQGLARGPAPHEGHPDLREAAPSGV